MPTPRHRKRLDRRSIGIFAGASLSLYSACLLVLGIPSKWQHHRVFTAKGLFTPVGAGRIAFAAGTMLSEHRPPSQPNELMGNTASIDGNGFTRQRDYRGLGMAGCIRAMPVPLEGECNQH